MSFVQQQEGGVKLRVIGAGLMRTGTSSLKIALEQLLCNPCSHMCRVAVDYKEPSIRQWLSVFENGGSGIEQALDGFGATVDYPACCFYKELFETHPGTKVSTV